MRLRSNILGSITNKKKRLIRVKLKSLWMLNANFQQFRQWHRFKVAGKLIYVSWRFYGEMNFFMLFKRFPSRRSVLLSSQSIILRRYICHVLIILRLFWWTRLENELIVRLCTCLKNINYFLSHRATKWHLFGVRCECAPFACATKIKYIWYFNFSIMNNTLQRQRPRPVQRKMPSRRSTREFIYKFRIITINDCLLLKNKSACVTTRKCIKTSCFHFGEFGQLRDYFYRSLL